MSDLRIAIVYDCLFPVTTGGGERVYRRMAELLVERGHQVDYLTRRHWTAEEPPAVFSVVPVWSGEIYDANGTRKNTAALAFALAVFRYLRTRRGRYDLVIVSALPVMNLFAVWLAGLFSRRFVVADWLEVWSWRKWRSYAGQAVGSIAFVLQYLGLRIGDVISVNSTFTRARIHRYRRDTQPVVLGLVDLVSGPATDAGQIVSERDADLVLFVGRHIPDKRLTSLPGAVAFAARARPHVRVVVVGSGPETEALRRAVAASGQTERFQIAGRVSDDELEVLLSSAAVLVNPSSREGFGLVVAEAAAHGTPSVVVAGEDNAAVDLVRDGVNGFVAASTSAEALGTALLRALDGGRDLRASTSSWFERARVRQNLAGSVDELLQRYEARGLRRASRAR